MVKYFEDFRIGEKFETPSQTLTESDIVSFGRLYDPQSFHMDPEAAKESIFSGLIASGFQTLSLAWTLFLRLRLIVGTSLGSPGLNYVKWLAPVRPGDTLSANVEVLNKRASSNPNRGVVNLKIGATNQNKLSVLEYECVLLVLRQTAGVNLSHSNRT